MKIEKSFGFLKNSSNFFLVYFITEYTQFVLVYFNLLLWCCNYCGAFFFPFVDFLIKENNNLTIFILYFSFKFAFSFISLFYAFIWMFQNLITFHEMKKFNFWIRSWIYDYLAKVKTAYKPYFCSENSRPLFAIFVLKWTLYRKKPLWTLKVKGWWITSFYIY